MLVFAQVNAADVYLSGRVKLFTSLFLQENKTGEFFVHDSAAFAAKRLETRFGLSGFLSNDISYAVRFDAFALPDALFTGREFPESSPAGAPVRAEPFDFFLYEGRIKISHFLLDGLDVTIGKQRIRWGTADEANVVDNLNPVDFANFLTFDPDYFGEKRPQTAINAEYYLSGSTKIQGVWLLSRQTAPLPSGFSDLAVQGPLPSRVHVDTEDSLLQNTNFGLRFSAIVVNTDIGLSYYQGNFHLPLLFGVAPAVTGGLDYFYSYPERKVFGLDAAGEILSVGFWGECALTIPEDVTAFIVAPPSTNSSPFPAKKTFPLFEDSYFKYVLGVDYTLGIGTGLYLNAQYLHGFFDERDYSDEAQTALGFRKGMFFGEIGDYLLVRGEYSLLRGGLKLELGGIAEFGKDGNSFSFMPSMTYKIKDLVSFRLGGFLVTGKEGETKFGTFKNDNILFVAFQTDF